MGWTTIPRATKQDIIKELTGYRDYRKIIAHTVKGNVLWTVEESPYAKQGRVIGCYLLEGDRDGWGYKDLAESSHPYYYTCPLKYLDMVPVANAEWREKVRAYHAERKSGAGFGKLAAGATVRLVPGCSVHGQPVTEVTLASVKPLIAMIHGRPVKIRRKLIAEVVAGGTTAGGKAKYVTGDGQRFATLEAAKAHCESVWQSTGVVIALEEISKNGGKRRHGGSKKPSVGKLTRELGSMLRR